MRILFILPQPATAPVGGYKVVYEYANRLSINGHKVEVSHCFQQNHAGGKIRNVLRLLKWRLVPSLWRPDQWMPIHHGVRLSLCSKIDTSELSNADVIIATSWETARNVADLPDKHGRKFYLIQHLETWSGKQEQVLETWRLPIHKIVIAKWLQQIAEQMGETASYVPNGLDQSEFYIETPLIDRDPYLVGSLYHQYDWKGSSDVLLAMENVVTQFPNARLLLFGAVPEPEGLPSWVEYHYKPSGSVLRALYNRMSVFVLASWEEGWGLTPCEALLCGCSIAVTDNGGHREFAFHNDTALICPIKRPDLIASSVLKLISDSNLRIRLSENGNAAIRQLTWDKAVQNISTIFENT